MATLNQVKQDLERKLCTVLNERWLDDCFAFLATQFPNGLPQPPRLTRLVEDQILLSDLERSTLGCLPDKLSTSRGQIIKGQFLVQVSDCINISEPRDRRFLHSQNRTLKLGLSDGKQSISALELTHIPQLSLDFPAGIKVRSSPSHFAQMAILSSSDLSLCLGDFDRPENSTWNARLEQGERESSGRPSRTFSPAY